MKNCPRCNMDLTITSFEPKKGEVWLRLSSKKLYRVIHSYDFYDKYAVAELLSPPGPQDYDQGAIFPEDVRRGNWVRVEEIEQLLSRKDTP